MSATIEGETLGEGVLLKPSADKAQSSPANKSQSLQFNIAPIVGGGTWPRRTNSRHQIRLDKSSSAGATRIPWAET